MSRNNPNKEPPKPLDPNDQQDWSALVNNRNAKLPADPIKNKNTEGSRTLAAQFYNTVLTLATAMEDIRLMNEASLSSGIPTPDSHLGGDGSGLTYDDAPVPDSTKRRKLR